MPITLARALFAYNSDVSGDLTFSVNDIIEVVRWENENWIHGNLNGVTGMFPSNFVEIISLPSFNDTTECLLGVVKDFVKEEDRDMTIKRGEIVVGIRQEDSNWWLGRSSRGTGIFPVSHVRRLTGGRESRESASKSLPRSDIPKPVRALASSDLKGQIDGELSFNAGDNVEIMRVVDDIFCEGTCHGSYGMFPLHVVHILEPENFAKLQNWCKEMNSAVKKSASLSSSEKRQKNGEIKSHISENERSKSLRSRSSTGTRSFTSETTSTPDVVVEAYGKAIASFVGENSDELTFVAGDLVKLTCHIDVDWTYGEVSDADGNLRRGIFPTRFVDIIVDCPYDEKAREEASNLQPSVNNKSVDGDLYGVVKYNFFGDRSDDLHITKGDRVRLLRWVDENWCEAEDDSGNIGQCPSSYLDILPDGSCHPRQLSQPQTADERRERFSFASCTNLSLDEAIANEMKRAQVVPNEKPSSTFPGRSVRIPLRKCQLNARQRPLSYHDASKFDFEQSEVFVQPTSLTPRSSMRKKQAPPRPLVPEAMRPPQLPNAALEPSPKPVPRRPVPPRPVPNASFSERGESDTIVTDLQKRIFSIEGDIKELQEASENSAAENSDSANCFYLEDDSIQGSLTNLRKDLKFYQDKLSEVTGHSYGEEAHDDMRQKRASQRTNVINELISTEKTYLHDLKAVSDTFDESSSYKSGVDLVLLFGNLQEVISLSQKLLAALQEACAVDGSIGEVFLQFREEMVHVYVEYCKNHEDAVKYLMRGDTQVNNFIQDGLARLHEKHNLFTTNLDALIIKPVQRVLKYPLLLNELLRSTEESNPDHKAIAEAVVSMTEAVREINELKRRKDLVQKYLRPQTVDSSAISLAHGMHTLRKKGARLSQRLSSTFGFKSHTIDEEFNREEARFRNCEKCIKVFLRDVQSHCDALKESINLHTSLCNDLFDFCADSQSNAEAVARTFLDAYIRAMDSFKNTYIIRIENRVLIPLYKLQSLFQGPNKLIKKRYDKMLDYDNMTHNVKKAKEGGQCSRVMLEALDKAEKIYEAMNYQLKEELPVLNQLSSRLLHECIGNFVQIATQLAEHMLIEIRPVLQASPLLTENNIAFRDILEAFTSQHQALVDRISRFTFVPKSFNSKSDQTTRFTVSSTSDDSSAQQLAEHRQSVCKQYPSDSLFIALQTVPAAAGDPKGFGIALREGDVVGVIKKADPMGNSNKWFVDNGASKGFVPAAALNPYSMPPPYSHLAASDPSNEKLLIERESSPTTVWYVNLVDGTFTDAGNNGLKSVSPIDASMLPPKEKPPSSYYEEIDFPEPDEGQAKASEALSAPEVPQGIPNQQVPPVEWYRALYAFHARNANEMSLIPGQMVQVIQKHDYSGNGQWWLVQADNKQGYVPSYYLQPL